MNSVVISSIENLENIKPQFDDLWHRADVGMPTKKANLLANFVEQFQNNHRFCLIAIFDSQKLVGALPLLIRQFGFCRVGELPNNPWNFSGDLLLDPTADAAAVFDCLTTTARENGIHLFRFRGINADHHGWKMFGWHLIQKNLRHRFLHEHFVGLVAIESPFADYVQRLSKNHRKKIRSRLNKIGRRGELKLQLHRSIDDEQIEPLLRQAFEIEHRGWKGSRGSSVLANDGLFEFYVRQAIRLNRDHQMVISFLLLNDQLIAYEAGYVAKQTYFSHKIGFDDQFKQFAPGQLLTFKLLEQFHCEQLAVPSQSSIRLFDTVGELSSATQKWINDFSQRQQLLASTGSRIGDAYVNFYLTARKIVRKIKRRTDEITPPPLIKPLGNTVPPPKTSESKLRNRSIVFCPPAVEIAHQDATVE